MKKWWQNLPTTSKVTSVLILATIAVWIGWDIYVAIEPTPGDTESEILRNWGWSTPSFVWMFGALCGHFWGTWDKLIQFRKRFPWSPFALGGLAVVLMSLDYGGFLPSIHPMISFLAGIPFGAWLWPQDSPED